MKRLVSMSLAFVLLQGCSATPPSPSPSVFPAATTPPRTVVRQSSSPSITASPTASPSPQPTLTPVSTLAGGGGTWTKVKGASLVSPNATAVRVGDRGVLVLHGVDNPIYAEADCLTPERSARGTAASFYDARTHAITRVSGAGGFQLRSPAAVAMRDGRVMLAGGWESQRGEPPTGRTRIWDPRTRKWAEGARMRGARAIFFLVSMADGRVMAIGGLDERDMPHPLDAELYDPASNRWMPTAPVELDVRSVVALGGGVLATDYETAALFDPQAEDWIPLEWPGGWDVIALPDGTALSFWTSYVDAALEAELPFAAQFGPDGETRVIGHWAPPQAAATTVLADGRVFSAGGYGEGGYFLPRAEILDPDTGQVWSAAAMPAARGASSAISLADGSVLVVGGVDTWETAPGNDTPGCVPVEHRVMRWSP